MNGDNEAKIYCLEVSRTYYDVFTVKAPSLKDAIQHIKELDDTDGLMLDEITDLRVKVARGADQETGEANDLQIRSCEHFGKFFNMTE